MKSHFNVHCPCDLYLLVSCLVSSFGAGMTGILARSRGLNDFSYQALLCREVIRLHSLVPIHFLPLILSLESLRSDASKLTTSFLCLLEAKPKMLVTWKKHSDLLLYLTVTPFFINHSHQSHCCNLCTLQLRKKQGLFVVLLIILQPSRWPLANSRFSIIGHIIMPQNVCI